MYSCCLGWCYANGNGVNKNEIEAAKYYQQGHASAQYNLGWCYAQGIGIDVDFKEAIMYFKLAAEQGNEDAHYNLDILREEENGNS